MSRLPFNPALVKGPPKASVAADNLLTVSQLTALVKQAVSTHLPATVHVIGQVSNFKRHSSGHFYWTLKDDASELACVMWRSDAERLKFQAADGLEVIATGGIDVFERAGRYQLYVRRLEPRGVGALELAFRQLREKLQSEGLFDLARKKPLPRFPRRIAVVTSPTGAAVRDVLTTLRRRFPCAVVVLYPVRVQGDGAAAEIADAVRAINIHSAALGGIDVMIVGRGGGSLEDLWAFNEELVARAIFASLIPVVCGVGHESDVTIAELVADVRAATPTAAAELSVPVLAEVLEALAACAALLQRCVRHRCDMARKILEAVELRPWLCSPLDSLRRREQRLDELAERIRRPVSREVTARTRLLREAESCLQRIHPRSALTRANGAVQHARERLVWAMLLGSAEARARVHRAALRIASHVPARVLVSATAEVARCAARTGDALRHRLALADQRLSALAAMLEATSHRATLARGFTITRRKRDRMFVTDPRGLKPGERLLTETASGEVESRVVDTHQLELFD